MKIVSNSDGFGGFSKLETQKTRFSCGGCDGLIHFEYKKEKGYATLQMKLLQEMEEKRKKQHLAKFFGVLRSLPIFEPLDDDALRDLTLLLDLQAVPIDRVVLKVNDPGSNLYIVLKGSVAIMDKDGSRLSELGAGEIFGEMSLLSGEPVTNSIHTIEATQLAILNNKNFKQVIVKHPVLQIFLFKMLVDRAQIMTLQSGNISSGMNGELSEISIVDLFQLINSSQKTGTIKLVLNNGKATVFFKDGQIISASFNTLQNQEAVFALLEVRNGQFHYTKGVPEELDNTSPIGDFMAMLMEGVQRLDEQQESENNVVPVAGP